MTKHIIDQWPSAPAALPLALKEEFVARAGNGQVGSRLVSETERVRVWHLSLKPGERIGFHTHVLDYFWTAVTAGQARSHYGDGRTVEVSYLSGDTQHHRYGLGEFMIHDLENIGETELVFTTVEFLDSANAPLVLPAKVGSARTAA
jgi:mannose-6-phosphate isomerase-like protein (cupin superfamily)